ncbi:MAG TPA: 2-oxoacid:acceptor oxidoreductase family protein, partial [Candidatus Limnocylindria bacterium]|nr:2-oxoacid:acceptor oxidoreductase family protein [Candidatus Limnocylindria bacterium]
ARRAAEASETPFLVVQDGFLTTHTLENARLPEDELLRDFVGDPALWLRPYFEPSDALMTGVVQNQDSYMKGRIGQRAFYQVLGSELRKAMDEWADLTGRRYGLVDPYRTDDAEHVLVAMGTIADTARTVVDHLRRQGRRVGSLAVTSFRPFPANEIAAALGGAVTVAVVERTDEPAAHDNPLTREVKAALADRAAEGLAVPRVVSASAGLGSRDVAPGDLAAVFEWLADGERSRAQPYAVLGIRHPLALEPLPIDVRPRGAYSLRGHSIGGFGSVTTNKLVATLVGELFDLYVQAYPRYGSEKKGLPTTYFLTIAEEPIRQHAELEQVDLVPLYDVAAFRHGRPLVGLVDGGSLFLQTSLTDPDAIWATLPIVARTEIMSRGIHVWALDTASLARQHAPRPELEVRMQGVALVGVFLRITPFAGQTGLERSQLLAAVEERLGRFFGKRGAVTLAANLAVITAAYDSVVNVTDALSPAYLPAPRQLMEAAR